MRFVIYPEEGHWCWRLRIGDHTIYDGMRLYVRKSDARRAAIRFGASVYKAANRA